MRPDDGRSSLVKPSAAAESSRDEAAKDGPPPPESIPSNLASVPDAVPRPEPRSETGNPDSYEVGGDRFIVLKDSHGYKERGYASWYGRKFQGKRTSSGERYDMFKMTAAHKTLPIPCYARVTNLVNGRNVVVRINDRGPFHTGRIIDLSYTAALKLGVLGDGSTRVEVVALEPGDDSRPTTLVAAAAPVSIRAGDAASAGQQTTATPAAATMSAAVIPASQKIAAAAPAIAVVPAPPPSTTQVARYLQAGLFKDPINAVTMRDQLSGMGIDNVQLKSDLRNGGTVSRVLIGPFFDEEALTAVRKRLIEVQLPVLPVIE